MIGRSRRSRDCVIEMRAGRIRILAITLEGTIPHEVARVSSVVLLVLGVHHPALQALVHPAGLIVVQHRHWVEELKRLVPTK